MTEHDNGGHDSSTPTPFDAFRELWIETRGREPRDPPWLGRGTPSQPQPEQARPMARPMPQTTNEAPQPTATPVAEQPAEPVTTAPVQIPEQDRVNTRYATPIIAETEPSSFFNDFGHSTANEQQPPVYQERSHRLRTAMAGLGVLALLGGLGASAAWGLSKTFEPVDNAPTMSADKAPGFRSNDMPERNQEKTNLENSNDIPLQSETEPKLPESIELGADTKQSAEPKSPKISSGGNKENNQNINPGERLKKVAHFTVGSFNVYYNTDEGAYSNDYKPRMQLTAQVATEEGVDLLYTQEMRKPQFDYAQQLLPGYGVYPENYEQAGYGAQHPIFYEKSEYILEEGDMIAGHQVLGNPSEKANPVAYLVERDSGLKIAAVNVHEPVGNAAVAGENYSRVKARFISAKLKVDQATKMIKNGYTPIIAGDMNAKYTAKNPMQRTFKGIKDNLWMCLTNIKSGGLLHDAWDLFKGKMGACPSYGDALPIGPGPDGPVDHITTTDNVEVDSIQYSKIAPRDIGSDSHSPLIIEATVHNQVSVAESQR